MFSDIARLFASPLRIKLIKFFALQPDERFLVSHIAASLATNKKKLQPELAMLSRAGVVVSRTGKGGRAYGWNRGYPRAFALQNFVIESTTPDDKTIAEPFRRIGVYVVIAAGMLADESRGSVDLLVVTRRPKDPRIAKAVKKLESLTAVPIRYSVMEVGDYHNRLQGYDRILRDITDFRHRVIMGRPTTT